MAKVLQITHDGRTMSRKQWAHELGITYDTFRERFRRCPQRAFHVGNLTASRPPDIHEHGGKKLTKAQWATELGITKSAFKVRLRNHPDKAFTPGKLPNQVPHKKLYANGGRTLTAVQWAAELGITKETFQLRYRSNPKTAFKVGRLHRVHYAKSYEYGGKQLTIKEIAELTGYAENTIRKRIKFGEAAQEKPEPKPSIPMHELHRPYFTFSNGGSLKSPHHTPVHPHHHHTGGRVTNFQRSLSVPPAPTRK